MTTTIASLIYRLDNAFWRFSLAVYQNKAVKEACLSFQKQQKANVNLLLLCCWLANEVEDVSKIELLQACHTVEDWHSHVTKTLRQTRNWINALPDDNPWISDFGYQILMDEIVSETYQQHLLYSCFTNKLTGKITKNDALAVHYIMWLFEDMTLNIDEKLKIQIRDFVRIVFSQVSTHETP
jgi:uncharacterized protein (TIGR02444 family)